jgi:hypothetical protein
MSRVTHVSVLFIEVFFNRNNILCGVTHVSVLLIEVFFNRNVTDKTAVGCSSNPHAFR